jgi:hypothetical protein
MVKNGKPLTPDELKKVDEKLESGLRKNEERWNAPKGEEHSLGVETFLRASLFSNERREIYRGSPVIALDFAPNPQFEPKGEAETIAHLLSGTVWIDEEAAQVVRLEAKLSGKFKVAGGLAASIREGSGAVFEQQRINGEVWMPSFSDVHFQGRALLFVALHEHVMSRFSDYRKFRAETRVIAVENTGAENEAPPAAKP